RQRVVPPHARRAVDVVVDAVVEVVRLEVAEPALLVERGEKLAHRLVERLHRPAYVHQEKEPDVVPARGAEDELDLAGVPARLVDRLVEVELRRLAAARELPHAADRDPELTDVERLVGPVVDEPPLLGDLHRRAALRRPPDADAGRVDAAVPERRPTAGADPPIAAVVALGLLLERLEEAAHELVGGKVLERGELLRRQLRERLRVLQPVEELLGHVVAERALDALEDAEEDAVERVEVRLALHEAGAGEVVEAEQARAVEALLERFEECAPLLDRDRHALGPEAVEEVEEHHWL